jgi:hypothetical protein
MRKAKKGKKKAAKKKTKRKGKRKSKRKLLFVLLSDFLAACPQGARPFQFSGLMLRDALLRNAPQHED